MAWRRQTVYVNWQEWMTYGFHEFNKFFNIVVCEIVAKFCQRQNRFKLYFRLPYFHVSNCALFST